MSRAIFVGVAIYDWDPTNPADATFLMKHPQDAQGDNPRMRIDSSRRPNHGADVATAIVDDFHRGATSVSNLGDNGGLYVERDYAARLGLGAPPAYERREYEFLTIQYANTDLTYPGYRYYGFHAIWVCGAKDEAMLVIFDAGDSLGTISDRIVRKKVDLTAAHITLPQAAMPSGQLPQAVGESGAIFLRCEEAENSRLLLPKLPQAASGGKPITC